MAWLVAAGGMVLVILSAGRMTEQYSSRYPGLAAPLIVLAASPYIHLTPARAVLLGSGMLLGAVSLASYFLH